MINRRHLINNQMMMIPMTVREALVTDTMNVHTNDRIYVFIVKGTDIGAHVTLECVLDDSVEVAEFADRLDET